MPPASVLALSGATRQLSQRESHWRNRRLCNLPDNFPTMPKAPSQRGLSPKATGGVSADTPSGSLRSPAPPRGRLCAMPETLSLPPKAVPLGKVASPQAMTEGVNSAQAHFALKLQTFPLCQRPHPRGGCRRRRLGEFRQLPSQSAHCVRSQLPRRGSFWHLPANTNKAPPLGELARRKP